MFAVNLSPVSFTNQFWIVDPSALLRACPESIEGTGFGFWIPPNRHSNLINQFAMRPHPFRSSSSQQNSDCKLQLLPTTVLLASTTHLGERSTAPLALSSTERLHKKPFACLPTALRPSGPVQQWIFHQAEQELTTLPGLRYSSGHRKGRLKILSL
jgi:hypothetical protein